MRHGDKINNLSRTKAHRKALLSNLACQLIEHKRIFTTKAKAKALRVYVEPIITKAKADSTHNRRLVFDKLQDKVAVHELFTVIGDKVSGRPGGYTRIIKLEPRFGDAAEMSMIELVDFNSLYVKGESGQGAKKTRRSRRGGGKKTKPDSTTDETTTDDSKVATPAQEKEKPTKEAKPAKEAKPTEETKAAKEAKPEKEPKTEIEATVEEVAVQTEDLTKIEGIGPKAAEALNNKGISSFAALAAKTPEEIKVILDEAEGNFNLLDPATWPQQADLAAQEKWEELKTLQDELDGGKNVEE